MNICARIEDNKIFVQFCFSGMRTLPTGLLTPATARLIADAGYDKAAAEMFFIENAKRHVSSCRE